MISGNVVFTLDVFCNVILDVTHNDVAMILSFRGKQTSDFAQGKRVKEFFAIERAARLKLDRLEAAVSSGDLAALPGNRFEALQGDRKGQI